MAGGNGGVLTPGGTGGGTGGSGYTGQNGGNGAGIGGGGGGGAGYTTGSKSYGNGGAGAGSGGGVGGLGGYSARNSDGTGAFNNSKNGQNGANATGGSSGGGGGGAGAGGGSSGVGGNGGNGGYGTGNGSGSYNDGGGGAGGYGRIIERLQATATISQNLKGGAGGNGRPYTRYSGSYIKGRRSLSAGGDGGAGLVVLANSSGASVSIGSSSKTGYSVTGGAGGAGGYLGSHGGNGIYLKNAAPGGIVTNYGSISGGAGYAARVRGGAGYTNVGGAGILFASAGATLNNKGTITGGAVGGAGILFAGAGATLNNNGTITGGASGGAGVMGASLTINDSGTITKGSGFGGTTITFTGGTNVLNHIAGKNYSDIAVLAGSLEIKQIQANGNISYFQSITGSGSVEFTSGIYQLQGSSTFSGGLTITSASVTATSDGALGATDGGVTLSSGTLLLGSFSTSRAIALTGSYNTISLTGTLAGVISGSGALSLNSGGAVSLSGANSYGGGTTFSEGRLIISADNNLGAAAGMLTLGDGYDKPILEATASLTSTRAVTLASDATVQVDDAGVTSLSGALSGGHMLTKSGTGTLKLTGSGNTFGGATIAAGTLDLGAAGTAGANAITFSTLSGGATATLALETAAQPGDSATFTNSLAGFNASSVLNLRGYVVTGSSYANGTLTLTGTMNGAAQIERYSFANPSSTNFMMASDGNGGTFVTVCFCTGTAIRCVRGGSKVDVAVEHLAIGDLAVTAAGACKPIRWIGHRTIDSRRHLHPHEAMPVRIAAHAFGENRPARDLRVSPGHSLCVDVLGEVLIPAGALINGTTILQEDVDVVTYWHVELEGGHDIIFAENMPAESYLDMGNRGFFAESDVVDLDGSPDTPVVTHADFCRPFHMAGALVEAVRARLAARATSLRWAAKGCGELHQYPMSVIA